jgi:rhodanese-related sulfurtransferase/DNA-binding MarR family transcriptional regulator
MGSDQAKSALFEAIAVMGKAFASPVRLELLDLLAQAPRSVDELARASHQSTANTSQHLQALYAAGLVTRSREGTSVRYTLAGDGALSLWLALRDVSAARLAEVDRAARDYLGAEVDTIGRDELIARMRAGEVVLLDVRPREEFEAGHIEGARSIPLAELEQRLDELPADREIVAYCRGPFCAYAHQAVRRLNEAGRRAHRQRDEVVLISTVGDPWSLLGVDLPDRHQHDAGNQTSGERRQETEDQQYAAADFGRSGRGRLGPARAKAERFEESTRAVESVPAEHPPELLCSMAEEQPTNDDAKHEQSESH